MALSSRLRPIGCAFLQQPILIITTPVLGLFFDFMESFVWVPSPDVGKGLSSHGYYLLDFDITLDVLFYTLAAQQGT